MAQQGDFWIFLSKREKCSKFEINREKMVNFSQINEK